MNIYLGSCENLYDFEGNKVQLCMYYWKRIHLGIIKNNRSITVSQQSGKTITGKHLERIEIKWGWK